MALTFAEARPDREKTMGVIVSSAFVACRAILINDGHTTQEANQIAHAFMAEYTSHKNAEYIQKQND